MLSHPINELLQPSTWDNALNQTYWTAKWIGAPAGTQKEAITKLEGDDQVLMRNYPGLKPVLYLRKHTAINPENIKRAKLYATARGVYKIFFNSAKPATINQVAPLLSPGWTEYTKTIQYQVYDVTDQIHQKDVVIGAMLGTGWSTGYVGYSKKYGYYGKDEFLLVQLQVEYTNGSKLVITSDNTWKVTTGPQIYSDILHGELFYEDRIIRGWMEKNYNDSAWLPVVTEPVDKKIKLVAEQYAPVSAEAILDVKDAWEISEGVWVYDFGVNFAGHVRLTLNDFKGKTTIKLKHGEALNPNGTVYILNLRYARARDTFVLNGKHSLFKHFFYF